MEQPNYYAILPANVRYDKTLKANEKLLYGEITALCDKEGYCWASNSYFSILYNVSKETISRWISNLKDKGYIESKIICNPYLNDLSVRVLTIKSIPLDEIINPPLDENVNHNNTSNNIKEINNNKLLFTKKSFKKPTLDEVKAYCQERKNSIDAEKFIDYYESNGWKVGRNSMKDWKACIRTWEKNNFQKTQNQSFKVKGQPSWFGKNLSSKEASKEEQAEIEELLAKYKAGE